MVPVTSVTDEPRTLADSATKQTVVSSRVNRMRRTPNTVVTVLSALVPSAARILAELGVFLQYKLSGNRKLVLSPTARQSGASLKERNRRCRMTHELLIRKPGQDGRSAG